jgi:integrase
VAVINIVQVNDKLAHVRGGEVVLFKRPDSIRWQGRFKLKDLKWHRVATKHTNVQYAAEVACEAYDRARFLFAENIPVVSKRFDMIAQLAIDEMQKQITNGVGKSVYNDYITATKRYLIPYFGKFNVNTIGYEQLLSFSEWRIKEMGKKPVKSTVTTHTSALNRVFDVAIERGWIAASQVPKMKNNGEKGTAREAFSAAEYGSLTSYMVKWCEKGTKEKSKQMRHLLRDYVLVLANTGMRHGTEAMGMKWNDVEWITKDGKRYLQFLVDGKVGRRTLIARHNTEDYLRRIQLRQKELKDMTFDELLKKKVNKFVFVLDDGEKTDNLSGTFSQLMLDSGLDKDKAAKQKRTLYSLRHTYAHFAILNEQMDVYTLAAQMGTSVKMIEDHYGHLKPSMKADVIAGKKMGNKKEAKDEIKTRTTKRT